MSKNDCQAYKSGAETRCGACGLVWDNDDPEPPQCGNAGLSVRATAAALLKRKFELWAVKEQYRLAQSNGRYFEVATRKAWEAFQAGAKLPR